MAHLSRGAGWGFYKLGRAAFSRSAAKANWPSATVAPRKAALQVALDAEETALRYYSQLVERTHDRNLRSMYAELANFEADHTEFLRRKLNEAKRATTGVDVV